MRVIAFHSSLVSSVVGIGRRGLFGGPRQTGDRRRVFRPCDRAGRL